MDLIATNVNKLPFVFLIFTSVLLVVINEKKIKKVVNMFSNKIVVFNFICIVLFSLYNFIYPPFLESKLRKRVTIDAILGLIVALFSYLDLKSAIFWIIWVVAYYLNKF
jgi:hypothetical protein|tara:strand:- start:170 stop:496 length:327 start_codon:yes stop_codon:yes gene_type:complete